MAVIDSLVVMRRSQRHAADAWIAARCPTDQVSAPVRLGSFLQVRLDDLCDAVFFAVAGMDGGWRNDGTTFRLWTDDDRLLDELLRIREMANQCGLSQRMKVFIGSTFHCEFDTEMSYRAFLKRFHPLEFETRFNLSC